MQEAGWRAAIFVSKQYLRVCLASFFKGFSRTYGRTWVSFSTLYPISKMTTLMFFALCVAYLVGPDQPPPSSDRTQSIAASISCLTSLLSESGFTEVDIVLEPTQ